MRSVNIPYVRIALASIGCVSVVIGVPWLVLLSMTLLALRYRAWEVLLLGVAMDFIWLPHSFIPALPLFTLGALLLLWGLEPFRNEILV